MWRSISESRLQAPILAVAAASALAVALVSARVLLTWRLHHLYLGWNLVLAWVPLILALYLERCGRPGQRKGWKFWSTAGAWLLFFPNAPYILTDLTHVKLAGHGRGWTDLLLVLLFAFIGLVLAFLSLQRVQLLIARSRGARAGWLLVLTVAFLAGFGVYLGRFERWNSWDLLFNPLAVLADGFASLHRSSARFTALFGVFLFTAHALLYSLTLLGPAARPRPASPQ